ncbi:GCN5-related N-acetyltransferase [Cordyceps fumosorosea ARSEF 2679]|uniref:GCN5-related N-acetyltransferase n=1 Tax=Cordyceps fumosorosea (strain ARSEF 2679) TaxID=1081104 RepID=A0A168AK54_CORFA|nr:GCN5-related N-acetyltransferase [Cordyceps fumosorosea ARSEF 2679]OAA68860.1 GCN5-related N-acetyltransferase [Cordyceps fumosorosea ARSEF 2679]
MEDRGTPRVRELDLRECKVSSTVDGINVVRGLKCSAAFFTFLRANLALSSSMTASPSSTPQLDPIYASVDPSSQITEFTSSTPTSSFSKSTSSSPGADLVPLDDIPELSLDVLRTEPEQREGLDLLADTVAGMRTPATVTVVSHPTCLVPLTTLLSVIYYARRAVPGHFRVTACCTYGAVLLYVLLVWCLAAPYKAFARDIRDDPAAWLDEEGPGRDIMVGARGRDNELLGVVVLRLSPKLVPTGGGPGGGGGHGHRRRGAARSLSFKGGRGLIRAWAVRRKSRGRGVGRELLNEVVRITRERCGRDAEVGFIRDHAHSRLVFHRMFHGFFHKVEIGADRALRAAVSEWSPMKRRKNK